MNVLMYANLTILFISITIICYYAKFKYFLKSFCLGASTGILTLGTTILIFPKLLNFNFFTMIMAIVAGAPGVVLEILIKQLFL